jgi:hypothetical protein
MTTPMKPPNPANNAPRGFGVPKAISPVADVQGASNNGTTYQNNDMVGAAGNPTNDTDRKAAVARRLQASVTANRNEMRTKDKF